MKLVFFLFTALIALGHSLRGQVLTAVKTNDYPLISFQEHFKAQNQYYFFSNKTFITSGFFIQVLDSTGHSEHINLAKLDKSIAKNFSPAYTTEYCFDGNNFFMLSRNMLFVFSYSGNKFKYIKSIKLGKKQGSHLYFNGKNLIVYELYNHHPHSENYQTGYTSVDLSTGLQVFHPLKFIYLPITHLQPNKFVCFAKSYYLLADPFIYKIKLFNYADKEIGSIEAPDSSFTISKKLADFSDTVLADKMAHGPSDYFAQLNADLADVDRIWTINLVDSTTLHVRLTRNSLAKNGKNQLFYDHIWKKINDHWQLTQNKFITMQDIKRDLDQSDLWPYFFPGSKMVYCDNALYYVYWGATNSKLPQNGEDFYGIKSFDRTNMNLKTITFKSSDR